MKWPQEKEICELSFFFKKPFYQLITKLTIK